MKHEELFVDFKSLQDNEAWQSVYTLYTSHINIFSFIINRVHKRYGMDVTTARDAVLYELISSYYEPSHRKVLHERKPFKWFFVYLFFLIGVLCSGIINFFFTLFQKNEKIDILYDEMWSENSWYNRFYKYIDAEIESDYSKALLYAHPGITKDLFGIKVNGWSGKIINRRYKSFLFHPRLSCSIFLKEFSFIWPLLKLSKNINIFFFYLRLLKRLLIYSSQIENVNATVLIAAGDYYWNPLKYHAYKKSISNIMLIQHNYKNEYLYNRLFQYCDHYFAHSQTAIDKLEGMPFSKKHAIGSFQLIPFLQPTNPSYDILFVSQQVYDNYQNTLPSLDQDKLIKQHNILMDNFKMYLLENPNMRCLYITKPSYLSREPALSLEEEFKDIKNLQFLEAYGEKMFDLISKSKLIINMYSSIGFEAYGLNKKVLWINYDHCCSAMKYDTEEEALHILIADNSYDTFKKRVNLLLSENSEVNEHYQSLKEKYMNIQKNPAKITADIIEKLIHANPAKA